MRQPLICQRFRIGGPNPQDDIVIREERLPVPPSELERVKKLVWRQQDEETPPTCGFALDEDGIRVIDADGVVLFRYLRSDFDAELQDWRRTRAKRS